MATLLRVTLVRSPIGYPGNQKRTVQALGLRKMRQSVELPDNPAVRGMVERVIHLVEVQEIAAEKPAAEKPAAEKPEV
ncbi:MAG: 50S ribosomal protein L30 [Anaerolineae bacterium]|jgi:large subunit ribosomal protein L30|nr:50S ribosomal protein L30 [Anaerolineae bacterium]